MSKPKPHGPVGEHFMRHYYGAAKPAPQQTAGRGKMALLERFDQVAFNAMPANLEIDEMRRAIAIAQAVEEWQRDGDVTAQFIMRRADELLEEKS